MAKRVIWAGPVDHSQQSPMTVEMPATTAIIPGSLVTIAANKLANSTADGTAKVRVLVAREIGEHYGKTITDPWTVDENMVAVAPRSGELVNVRLAASQTVVTGDGLTSNGDGSWKKAAPTDFPLLFAREDVTTGVGVTSTLCQAVAQ